MTNTTLATPLRAHGRNLSGIAEYLHADNTILRQENVNLRNIIGKRKERLATKRIILKGKFILTTEIIQNQLAEAERQTKEKRSKKGKKKAKASGSTSRNGRGGYK